jgi:hypothetical protein
MQIRHVKCCGFSNTAVAIFRVKVCLGFQEVLYKAGNRWQVRFVGCKRQNIGTGCCPPGSKLMAEKATPHPGTSFPPPCAHIHAHFNF